MELPQEYVDLGYQIVKVVNPCELLITKDNKPPTRLYREEEDSDGWTHQGSIPYDVHTYTVEVPSEHRDAAMSLLFQYWHCSCECSRVGNQGVFHVRLEAILLQYQREYDNVIIPTADGLEILLSGRFGGRVRVIYQGKHHYRREEAFYSPERKCLLYKDTHQELE